jgi:hypothetical protein
MNRKGSAAAAVALAMSLSACGGAQNGGDASSGPVGRDEHKALTQAAAGLAPRYQKRLDDALAKAQAGRSPTSECTVLTGLVAGNPPRDGAAPDPGHVAAFEACYVDVSAVYIRAKLAQGESEGTEEAQNSACATVASHLVVQHSSLGQFAENVGLKRETLGLRIKERLGEAIVRRCDLDDIFPG